MSGGGYATRITRRHPTYRDQVSHPNLTVALAPVLDQGYRKVVRCPVGFWEGGGFAGAVWRTLIRKPWSRAARKRLRLMLRFLVPEVSSLSMFNAMRRRRERFSAAHPTRAR